MISATALRSPNQFTCYLQKLITDSHILARTSVFFAGGLRTPEFRTVLGIAPPSAIHRASDHDMMHERVNAEPFRVVYCVLFNSVQRAGFENQGLVFLSFPLF